MVDQFCANTWNGINRNFASTLKLEAWGEESHALIQCSSQKKWEQTTMD